jgi:hypothetical protein
MCDVSPKALAQFVKPIQFAPEQDGVAMRMYPGDPEDPALLISITHNLDDFFAAGVLRNNSTRTIKAYRIGWLMYPKGSTEPVEREGPIMNVPEGIKPGANYKLPPQGVEAKELLYTHYQIGFYVAEVILDDGMDWHPSLAPIKAKFKPVPPPVPPVS